MLFNCVFPNAITEMRNITILVTEKESQKFGDLF